jgi:hypothetical protein
VLERRCFAASVPEVGERLFAHLRVASNRRGGSLIQCDEEQAPALSHRRPPTKGTTRNPAPAPSTAESTTIHARTQPGPT